MNRRTALAIIERFNCELRGETVTFATIDETVEALAATDYGDGVPTADELDQLRYALALVYLE